MPYITEGEPKPIGSYPDSGIDVLIVGTGLAGLTAAIECRRKGHKVRILEKCPDINTQGDMYFMGLSATKFFKHWPEMAKEFDEISLHNAWIETYKHEGELVIPPIKVSVRLREAGLDPNTPPGLFQMRPLVYRMYIRQVERLGIPITFNKKVVDYWEDIQSGKGGVTTEDGDRYEADVVIAADGVGSKAQKLVGGQVRAMKSGRAMWRAAFDIKYLDKNPEIKEFFSMHTPKEGGKPEPIVRTWLGPGTYAMSLTRPDTIIWIMNHDVTGSEKESWTHTVEADDVLRNMDNKVPKPWDPKLKELVKLTPPKTIINFELFWRNPQPKWASQGARVINIGDAAHSFLPASGNGATQAIEDAVSLAACLQIGGRENVPMSVRAHVRMRFIRNACAQKLGFSNAELLQDTDWKNARMDPRKAQPKMPKWVWQHDPEKYAYEVYDHVVDSMKRGIPFDQDFDMPPNYPPGYKYEPWKIEDIRDAMRAGRKVELGAGDWS
ncbi:hypothetical protein SMACR_07760 [Sordaria macrospora]|uniref:WGS project CABT00000000 data, contig 2.47 n=2 Tax=Sordaria macrospora TaxID=5147 RepID=F7W8Y0_SORMK|nr:uncharacterized protein SMAC_07760 [Sordaria macrospora k-hell]KAA8630701.1 hypothetical protein SMACR_07760 [Sordaria macrospora]KAH7629709.1 hypothetical protein B0T09DRAFT_409034 [Sordaria sp. MPI-SDFR-AT-0083]WPJ66431.1 hypothetical protein SMAC4_07760 [Sordaria macrospora]CCC05103.1 unnamed protein product [Sordaria macrospora k-hell]